MNAEPPEISHEYRMLQARFREYLASRNFSSRTVEEYPREIEPFLQLLEAEGVENIRSVTARHVQAYQSLLMERQWRGRPLSPSTLNRRLGEVKSFFKFLHKTGRIYHDPTANLELPKRGKHLPRGILEVKEVMAMLEKPDLTTPLGIRDKAVMELLYSSGLRASELRHLEVHDLDLESSTLRVHGKGGKEALVPFGVEARRALEHYLLFARSKLASGLSPARPKSHKWLKEEKGRQYLFLTKAGHRWGEANLYMRIRGYAKAVGIERKIGPHSFRHSCATHLLRGGADIRHIQRLLRHKDLNTTQIYTRVAIEDLKQAQLKYHPRERISRRQDNEQQAGDE